MMNYGENPQYLVMSGTENTKSSVRVTVNISRTLYKGTSGRQLGIDNIGDLSVCCAGDWATPKIWESKL